MDERSLEQLVTDVAAQLMPADAVTSAEAATAVLRDLVEYFGVDVSFLRRNDHSIGATVLVAEWPVRENVPVPDPLGVVYFRDADPVFASAEHAREVLIVRPEPSDFQDRVREGTGVAETSMAAVPLLSGPVTTGVLGFVKFGDRAWLSREINALKAIATLFAQLQARVVAEVQLRYLANHDELTGLSNRRMLLAELERRLQVGEPGPVALLFLDVDRLKVVNDLLGHTAGDVFIHELGSRLQKRFPNDVVVRLGGDEFVVLISQSTDVATAELIAKDAQAVAARPISLETEEVGRTVSVGVAVADPGECSVVELLRQADEAVLAAKADGGNAVVICTEEMRAANDDHSEIEMHLRAAIRNGELEVYYQPVVDLASGVIVGVEALVRWNHPVRGLLQPDAFIEIAEAANLSGELGRKVLREACRQLAQWLLVLPDQRLQMCVNVSPAQLITSDFVDCVADELRTHGLSGDLLTLEITEHAVMHDLPHVLATLRGLEELGVHIAIDDFGTGHSSLGQLKVLPVSTLKIDRGFVHELGVDHDDLAIVQSIMGLAASFGLNVVAEGVDTSLAAEVLMDLGCRYAQGFLFSRPVQAERLLQMLRQGRMPTPISPYTRSPTSTIARATVETEALQD